MTIWSDILQAIGLAVVAGGGLSLIVYQIFKHLAAKWLDSRFSAGLQKLIHEQNKEVERLRSELTKEFDHVSKLRQREFETLPELWSKISDAYWQARSLVAVIQTHPDLDRMHPDQLEEFIVSCELANWQKSQLRESREKTTYYRQNIYWHRLHAVKQALRDANSALSKFGIFVEHETCLALDQLVEMAWQAISEDEVYNFEGPGERVHVQRDKLAKEGEALRSSTELKIKRRIWAS